ncbi:uncharacterized protein LOC128194376 [Vigna angularis]|uniref:uncharacterized protein LOC128194376 n=1 Tax=Phaseolus angularis TaxID=3914 RepID=UPI0022B4FB24|nr:uncharacterized protein LOC128194376 [Vigna angularis]
MLAQVIISVSSAIANSIAPRQNQFLSPEDLAWADSCLVKDSSDISETDWVPLKSSLLEIISSQTKFSREDIEIPPHRISSESISVELNQQSSTSDGRGLSESSSTYNVNSLSMLVETSTDEILDDETSVNLPSFNPFLPTYNENLKEEKTIDFGLDLDSSSYETEQLADNIFKIWDLDIPSEEDGRKREKGRKDTICHTLFPLRRFTNAAGPHALLSGSPNLRRADSSCVVLVHRFIPRLYGRLPKLLRWLWGHHLWRQNRYTQF